MDTTNTKELRHPAAVLAWTTVVVGLPVLAALALAVTWRGPSLVEATVGGGLYVVAGMGISIGWHRFFTHRGFRCGPVLTRVLAIAGSLAFEGSLSSWVANHRVHHMHTDRPGDPHSPWTESGRVRGFLHAHVGWLLAPGADEERFARDIVRDRGLMFISRSWWVWSLAALLLPAALAGAFAGVDALWGMLLWGGFARVVLFHHVTWSVNSICHMYGKQPFAAGDESRNVWWLSLLSFGESWHNNHHHSPRTARHGLTPLQVDLSAATLRVFERAGLISDCHWSTRSGREYGADERSTDRRKDASPTTSG